MNWFTIDIYYPIVDDFYKESSEMDEEMVKAHFGKKSDGYLIAEAEFNLGEDPVKSLQPGTYLRGSKKAEFTLIIFCSGDVVAVPFARKEVSQKLREYYNGFIKSE